MIVVEFRTIILFDSVVGMNKKFGHMCEQISVINIRQRKRVLIVYGVFFCKAVVHMVNFKKLIILRTSQTLGDRCRLFERARHLVET